VKHYQTFKFFEFFIYHIDNVDDMEHNDEPFSPPHGKVFQMDPIELAKEVLNQLGDWHIIWTKHTIIM
jgi:hypothetical protein